MTTSTSTSKGADTVASIPIHTTVSDQDNNTHQPQDSDITVSNCSNKLRSMNWKGCIPVEITLSKSSLSSPSMPPPLYRMVSRQSYLHLSLLDVIERLSMFAVTSPSIKQQQQYAVVNNTWLEDKQAKKPLRWHLFAGVLFDLLKAQQEHKHTLPWKLILHFSSYPHDKILSLTNGLDTVKQYYFNSLKQSLYMQYGNAKKSTSEITKHHHDILWKSIQSNNYEMFSSVNQNLQLNNSSTSTTMLLPIRVLLDSHPVLQKPYRILTEQNWESNNSNNQQDKVSDSCGTTLGDLLLHWLPTLFHVVSTKTISCADGTNQDGEIFIVQSKVSPIFKSDDELSSSPQQCCKWYVQGITPSLESPLLDLWYNLCHPDLFLYVIVRTRSDD